MTWKTKIRVIISITALMGFAFVMMSKIPVGQIVLTAVWAGHVLYFLVIAKTRKEENIQNNLE